MSTTGVRTQRANSLQGFAMVIARRLQAIRDIADEKNEQPKSGELARQFRIMCERATLTGGDISTAEMCELAVTLVPEAVEFLAARQAA